MIPTDLGSLIRAAIETDGPITVERFMALALADPVHGYYMRRDPFGRSGDFVTAPEISQMFGELVGLWLAATWQAAGSPSEALLVELGPGRGTLMADLLRATRAVPAFRAAVRLHLVETSPALRERQAETLRASGVTPVWHGRVEDVPGGAPLFLIANEFFDALPIRQFVANEGRWRERLVGLDPLGRLTFGVAAESAPGSPPAAGVPDGAFREVSVAGSATMRHLAGRIRDDGGALLVIDYGHVRSGLGDTLQAVRDHRFVDPLAEPGLADLTTHVDFVALAAAARSAGAIAHGPLTQAGFLHRLGLAARAARLDASGGRDGTEQAAAAAARLTDVSPRGMGRLFKVLAITRDESPPPAFDNPDPAL